MSKKRSIFYSISSITILTLLGQILTFGREAIFAAYFGLSYQADAYVVATQIPVILFAVIGVGITTSFLPMYIQKKRNEGEVSATYFIDNASTVFLIISLIFGVTGAIYTEQIVKLFAPSYDGRLYELTVYLSRITFSYVIFNTFINILKAVHHAWESYVIPIITVYLQSIFVILSIVFLGNRIGVLAPVLGTLLALFLQAILIQLTIKKRYLWKPKINLSDPDLKKIVRLISPVIIGVGIAEINRVIDRILATGLPEGSVAALNFASKLVGVLGSLLVAGLSVVSYQKFSNLYAEKNMDKLQFQINKFLSITAIMAIPATVGMIFLNHEIIYIVYGRGEFTSEAVEFTSRIFIYYSLGLFLIVIREILSKAFYAMNNTKTPMVNSSIGLVINISLNLLLVKKMGAVGLALATSITSLVICILLILSIRNNFDRPNFRKFYISVVKSVFSSFTMLIILHYLPQYSNPLIKSIVYILIGMLIYYISHLILKTDEVMEYSSLILKKIKEKLN